MLRVLLWALLALPITGCLTIEGRRAIVPFFEIYEEEASYSGVGKANPEELKQKKVTSVEYVFRPFGSFESIGEDRQRIKLIWPLMDASWGGDYAQSWIFPVFFYRERYKEEVGGTDTDFMLFPFIYAGHEPEEGNYFAFFPFFGKIRGILAKDEINLFMFPLYWHSYDDGMDSMHLVWPFFNRVHGGGYKGWRIFPFYGNYEAFDNDGDPRYRKSFIFWPFYVRQSNLLNSVNPQELFFTFPLYGYSEGPNSLTETFLWPFWITYLDKRTGAHMEGGWLFPYRFSEGQQDYWPFFGIKETKKVGLSISGGSLNPFDIGEEEAVLTSDETEVPRERFRQFALWPIQRYDSTTNAYGKKHRFWLLPLLWRFYEEDQNEKVNLSEWKLWPFYRYRYEDEVTSFNFPSPHWFRQENPFERQYARLWRLFLYRDNPEYTGWEFLYGFLSHRSEKNAEADRFSIFYGLLEWSTDEEGHGFRFLYLPWR